MQYDASFHGSKNSVFWEKICGISPVHGQKNIFLFLLEKSHRGGSNVYKHSMVLSRHKEDDVYSC